MKPPIPNNFGGKDDRDDISSAFTGAHSINEAIAQALVLHMKALELAPAEIIFLEYLIAQGFSWNADCCVSPSLKEMQRVTGLAPGTIHAAKKGLVKKGFIKISNERNTRRTNTYNLIPLRDRIARFLPLKSNEKSDIGSKISSNRSHDAQQT